MLDSAIAFYHAVLTASKTGAAALEYLHGRGFTDETIEALPARLGARRLGPDDAHAPGASATSAPRSSSRSGSPRRDQTAAAASTTSSAPASSSRSATRTATPSGSAAASLEGEGPKYLNSPATPLFDKSRTLYLIDKAKGPIRNGRPGRHRRGLHGRADGPPGRLRQRRRQPRHGADARPGRAAHALRGPDRARLRRRRGRREGRHARGPGAGRAHRPAPARHVRGQARGRPRRPAARRQGPRRGRPRGARGLGARPSPRPSRSSSTSSTTTRPASTSRQSSGRIGFVEAVMPAIRDIADPLRRDEALGEVRRVSGVEERVLRQVLERPARSRRTGPRRRPAGRGSPRTRCSPRRTRCRSTTSCARSRPVEAELLRLLLLVPDQQLRVVDELGPDQLPSTVARELFRAIVLQREPNDQGIHPPFDAAALLLALDDETAALARALYAKPGPDRADPRPGAARLRGRPPAPRARGRPAARAQRLQRGRPGGGRARRRRARRSPA